MIQGMRRTAMKRLLIEAEKGNADAQFNLAVLYDNRLDDNGHPGADNRAEAVTWLQRAAGQGLSRAQSRLAEILAEGPDADQSYIDARKWFLVAIRNSTGAYRDRAQKGLDRISQRMSAEQIDRATHLAKIWTADIAGPETAAAVPRKRVAKEAHV